MKEVFLVKDLVVNRWLKEIKTGATTFNLNEAYQFNDYSNADKFI